MAPDAISVLKNEYSMMTKTGQQSLLKELKISDIGILNILRPEVAEAYCKTHNINLGNNSVWNNQQSKKDTFIDNYMTRVDKHNKYVESLIAKYKEAEIILSDEKKAATEQSNKIFSKYNVGSKAQLVQLKKMPSAEKTAQNLPFVNNSDIDKVQQVAQTVAEADSNYTVALEIANEESHRIVTET